MSDWTYVEQQLVRVDNKPAVVARIRLDGTVDVLTARGLRTVVSDRVRPSKRGDVRPAMLSQPPEKRKGRR